MIRVVIVHGPSLRRPPKVDLRTLAKAVAILQVAEGMALHAERDGCVVHALMAHQSRRVAVRVIPRRLLRNAEWVHRHIQAPGMRMQARIEDEAARD